MAINVGVTYNFTFNPLAGIASRDRISLLPFTEADLPNAAASIGFHGPTSRRDSMGKWRFFYSIPPETDSIYTINTANGGKVDTRSLSHKGTVYNPNFAFNPTSYNFRGYQLTSSEAVVNVVGEPDKITGGSTTPWGTTLTDPANTNNIAVIRAGYAEFIQQMVTFWSWPIYVRSNRETTGRIIYISQFTDLSKGVATEITTRNDVARRNWWDDWKITSTLDVANSDNLIPDPSNAGFAAFTTCLGQMNIYGLTRKDFCSPRSFFDTPWPNGQGKIPYGFQFDLTFVNANGVVAPFGIPATETQATAPRYTPDSTFPSTPSDTKVVPVWTESGTPARSPLSGAGINLSTRPLADWHYPRFTYISTTVPGREGLNTQVEQEPYNIRPVNHPIDDDFELWEDSEYIEEMYIITNPGRLDTDGVIQPVHSDIHYPPGQGPADISGGVITESHIKVIAHEVLPQVGIETIENTWQYSTAPASPLLGCWSWTTCSPKRYR